MTTGCPSAADSLSPTMRARMSAVPPAPEETTMWIGLLGHGCAPAGAPVSTSNATAHQRFNGFVIGNFRRSRVDFVGSG